MLQVIHDKNYLGTIKPYYGHSMKIYKGNAYIYGGFNLDILD